MNKLKTLGINENFLSIDDKYSNLENSEVVIVSAPYEHTVSYGQGTANGPRAIIGSSAYVEFYDNETDKGQSFHEAKRQSDNAVENFEVCRFEAFTKQFLS